VSCPDSIRSCIYSVSVISSSRLSSELDDPGSMSKSPYSLSILNSLTISLASLSVAISSSRVAVSRSSISRLCSVVFNYIGPL
jgi:hypothetical protein